MQLSSSLAVQKKIGRILLRVICSMPDRWLKRFCEKVVVRQIFEELFKFLYIIFKENGQGFIKYPGSNGLPQHQGGIFFCSERF